MIATFYSFKGGVGRSMALVNVAEFLADAGYKVLACDWDLEAPGLERYFCENREEVLELLARPGVIDLLRDYKEAIAAPRSAKSSPTDRNPDEFVSIGKDGLRVRSPISYAVKVDRASRRSGGWIKLLTAGKRDGASAAGYTEAVRDFDWTEFYRDWAGAAYLDFFRAQMEAAADIILVDSRTGVTEAGGVCTHHLPDLVLLFSAANDQNVEGTRWMADILQKPELREMRGGRDLALLAIPSRIEISADVDSLPDFRRRFIAEFSRYLPAELENLGSFIERAEIPYIARYSFRETIVARLPEEKRLKEIANPYKAITDAIICYGNARQLLRGPVDISCSPSSAKTPRATALVPRGQFILLPLLELPERNLLGDSLRNAGLDLWTHIDSATTEQSRVSPYYDALERSAGRLLLVNAEIDELVLNAEINAILARQARHPEYRALLLVQPGNEALEKRNLLMRRLPRIDLTGDDLRRQIPKIIATLLPEPGLIPEADKERLREKIKATTELDSRFFLGRDTELGDVLALLSKVILGAIVTERRLTVISGAAGEGRTALIQAGVIPALRRGLLPRSESGWRIANILLTEDQVEETLRGLRSLFPDQPVAPTTVDPTTEAADLVKRTTSLEQNVALIIDGIDTIALRHGWESDIVRRFFEALKQTNGYPKLLVVLSVRSSFLDPLLARTDASIATGNVYTIPAMGAEGMRTFLEGAARLLGCRFEAGLVERIITDARVSGVPSRSLRVLLSQLCETGKEELLSHKEYSGIGGIEGVTVDEVGRSLGRLTGPPLQASKALITSLIQVHTGGRISLPRESLLSATKDLPGSGEAFVQLLDWNVLTSAPDDSVSLVSDAIVKLKIVQQWVAEDYEQLKLQADLEDLARKWNEARRPSNLLPAGEVLARYREARVLGVLPGALLEAAARKQSREQRRELVIGFTGLLVIVGIVIAAIWGVREIIRARTEMARVKEAQMYAVESRADNEKLRKRNEELVTKAAQLEAQLQARTPQLNGPIQATPSPISNGNTNAAEPSASPANIAQQSEATSASKLPPRIYFETGTPAGVSEVRKLQSVLQPEGFSIQLPKNITGGALGYSEVKYYFPEDAKEASQLITMLRKAGITNVRSEPRQVVGPSDARPRHFDVWIDPPRPKQEKK
jgi:cell division protein FtsB